MDPFTIAAGLGAVGSLFSGIMGFNSGNQQAKALQAAAQQTNNEAGVNAQISLEQGDRTAAAAATQAAAGGGGLGGSSLGVIQDLSRQSMFNARSTIYRGETQSQNDLYDASVAKSNATNSLISGAIGAGSSLLGGFAKSTANTRYLSLLNKAKGLGVTPQPDYGYGG